MKWYMKGHFDFYGINAPARKDIVKSLKSKYNLKDPDFVIELARELWQEQMRESQYIALDILAGVAKKLNPRHMSELESMIITKSWWDTVDNLAPNLAGLIFQKFVDTKLEYLQKWIDSDNMWLNRSAIIHQTRYKDQVDLDILATAILSHDQSKEFFIRKAQGWALREVSKKNPKWVFDFLNANPQLSGLTHKEASKYL
jgi:3-methyladenine DNA glycosylase AlkD